MDIARITDEANTRLTLEHTVVQDFSRQGKGAFLSFEGRGLPVGARSDDTPPRVWQIEVVYPRASHNDVNALLSLLDTAFSAMDGRLVIRPEGASESLLSPRTVAEVHAWQVARQGGGVVRVSFTANEVAG